MLVLIHYCQYWICTTFNPTLYFGFSWPNSGPPWTVVAQLCLVARAQCPSVHPATYGSLTRITKIGRLDHKYSGGLHISMDRHLNASASLWRQIELGPVV